MKMEPDHYLLIGMWISIVFVIYNASMVFYLRRRQRIEKTTDRKGEIDNAAVWAFFFILIAASLILALGFY